MGHGGTFRAMWGLAWLPLGCHAAAISTAPIPAAPPKPAALIEWRLHPVSSEETLSRTVEVVVHVGAAERRHSVRVEGFGYQFVMAMQCQPRAAGRVAELDLNGGGDRVYALDALPDGRLSLSETLASDGRCGADGSQTCPGRTRPLAILDVPRAETYREQFIELDEAGAGEAQSCPTQAGATTADARGGP